MRSLRTLDVISFESTYIRVLEILWAPTAWWRRCTTSQIIGMPHRRTCGFELGPVEQLFLACAAGANDTSVVASADNRTACVSATSIVAAFFIN